MTESKKRIAVDMDEVMADAVGEYLLRYNRDFGENVTVADMAGKRIWDFVEAERHDALEAYLLSEDFFANLDVMPESQRVLRALQERYEVYIATAAMEVPSSFLQKYRWLREHFPFIRTSQIVFCGDKSIIRADYLIDDSPRQLRRFGGEGILYTSHHNLAENSFRRVHNWLDVEQLFLR